MNSKKTKEIWKPIPNYKGLYEASNLGRIRSITYRKRISPSKIYGRTGRILISGINNKGYPYVNLCKNGKANSITIHRLVVYAFLGVKKDMQIDHINSNRTDNRLINLRYCTRNQNMCDYKTAKPMSGIIGVQRTSGKRFRFSTSINGIEYKGPTSKDPHEAAFGYLSIKTKLKSHQIILDNHPIVNYINKHI